MLMIIIKNIFLLIKLQKMNSKGIYKILNLTNNKLYVGSATSSGGFKKRWNEHKSGLKRGVHSNKHLQYAWNKYGEDNFKFEIIEVINDVNEVLKREQYYLDTLLPEYNICKQAGNTLGVKLSPEAKLKLSEYAKLRTGINSPMYGKNHTNDTKIKISLNKKGKCGGINHPLYGKKHSELTKIKQSLAKKGKISSLRIKINQLDKNGNLIKTWDSISEAATYLNFSSGNIVSCLKYKLKTAYGFKWEYAL